MALARVLAGEYPHWYVVLPTYRFAESIGISHLLARQHFPSNILAGKAIGFLSGGYVPNHQAWASFSSACAKVRRSTTALGALKCIGLRQGAHISFGFHSEPVGRNPPPAQFVRTRKSLTDTNDKLLFGNLRLKWSDIYNQASYMSVETTSRPFSLSKF